jgi:hypothetical protein
MCIALRDLDLVWVYHVRIMGPKKMLWVATFPVEARDVIAKELAGLFDIPCETLPNFLNLTLTPSNQVEKWARGGVPDDWRDGPSTFHHHEVFTCCGYARRRGGLMTDPLQDPPYLFHVSSSPLTPGLLCQIIHPARYFGIFRDWDGKRAYSKKELEARNGLTLYKGMDEFSAEMLAVLDNELQQIKVRDRLGPSRLRCGSI